MRKCQGVGGECSQEAPEWSRYCERCGIRRIRFLIRETVAHAISLQRVEAKTRKAARRGGGK